MTTYIFALRGEDHTEFTWVTEADDEVEAYENLDQVYPEATVISWCTEEEAREIENARYDRLARLYDDGYYNDY